MHFCGIFGSVDLSDFRPALSRPAHPCTRHHLLQIGPSLLKIAQVLLQHGHLLLHIHFCQLDQLPFQLIQLLFLDQLLPPHLHHPFLQMTKNQIIIVNFAQPCYLHMN